MYINKKLVLGLFGLFISANSMAMFNEGPYVFSENEGYRVELICAGKARSFYLQAQSHIEYCGQRMALELTPNPPQVSQIEGAFPVAALSDIHGQYDIMIQLLKANKIVDENGSWVFGKGHLVITGDIFDRGSQVTEALWYIKWLEGEALKYGGRVHFLLGNHEVMVLNGDLRYLHKKYLKAASLIGTPFEQLFSKKSVLGQWLRSKNVVIKINENLFLHGGFHPNILGFKASLKEINRVFRAELVADELSVAKRSKLGRYLHGTKGPIWYRGLFSNIDREALSKILAYFNASRFIVGHTSHSEVVSRHFGKVIGIDSSIKLGHKGELLLIDKGVFWRADTQGQRVKLHFGER
ncbi:hypothetical protein A7985_23470 [Pseudoalteromonas luteoviolacea]|uniref:Calcineurin-like phosphoesterase domain-containing protein n=1 Tax=Pseudoalteromonas luteoviolacea TaxID=43657 RepID=A0A1C0TJK7_9GAMM|nr:metallophosphoesterase [Pseudoalteromonas luteoviolacea]OCQ18420.1 hypothetical protein A7985_23470 [Pseudoalteromonas luteoviolacea]